MPFMGTEEERGAAARLHASARALADADRELREGWDGTPEHQVELALKYLQMRSAHQGVIEEVQQVFAQRDTADEIELPHGAG